MPKGYWLPQIDVSDMEGYKAYMAATPPAHEKYKGVALARGGRSEVVEGRVRSRCVIREFPDYAAALACYRSDEYQRARLLRLPHSQCDFVIAEGFDDPQPAAPAAEPGVKKGYWIVHLDVTDAEAYKRLSARAARASRANSGHAFWCAAAPGKCRRVRFADAPLSWNSRASTRHWPAIARRTMSR